MKKHNYKDKLNKLLGFLFFVVIGWLIYFVYFTKKCSCKETAIMPINETHKHEPILTFTAKHESSAQVINTCHEHECLIQK